MSRPAPSARPRPESAVSTPGGGRPGRWSISTTRHCSTWTGWSTSARSPSPAQPRASPSLRDRGAKVGFVTNNAARSPAVVAEHLVELGIAATAADVVTSAQAAAHLLVARFGLGARVLVVGGEGVAAAVAEAGLVGVTSADDSPVAVHAGLRLRPDLAAAERGRHRDQPRCPLGGHQHRPDAADRPWPGARQRCGGGRRTDGGGGRTRSGRQAVPATAGRHRGAGSVPSGRSSSATGWTPTWPGRIVAGLDSLFVLSGSHGAPELLAAEPLSRPTHLGWDLRALLEPVRVVTTHERQPSVWRRRRAGRRRPPRWWRERRRPSWTPCGPLPTWPGRPPTPVWRVDFGPALAALSRLAPAVT